MALYSLAGQLAPASMLVDIPRLITTYYTEAANLSVPERGEGRASSVLPQETVRETKEACRNEATPH